MGCSTACTATTTTTDQIGPAQQDAAISGTCVRARFVGKMVGSHAVCTDCCIVLCWSYLVSGGGCSCMLLAYPVPTSADAGPDLCTLCPDLCTLHPDLCILHLWYCPSLNWCNHSTCTGGGCHQLQLAMGVFFLAATSADSSLAHMVVLPLPPALVVLIHPPTGTNTCTWATCTVRWWSVWW